MFVSPDVAVGHVGQARRNDQEKQDRQARTMAALQLGFCRPVQEGSNVLRHLIHRRLGPIGVSDLTVTRQRRRQDRKSVVWESVCQSGQISGGAASVNKQKKSKETD